MTKADTTILRDAGARLDHQAERIEYLERRLKERDQDARDYHNAGLALLGIIQPRANNLSAEESEIYDAMRNRLVNTLMQQTARRNAR